LELVEPSKDVVMKFSFKELKNIFPHRIWPQTFFILSVLVITPLIFLGSILVHTSQNAIKTSVLQDHRELVIHIAEEIKQYVENPEQTLSVTASLLGTLPVDPWRQETCVVELALRYPIFQRIASVDLNGREIVSSELGSALMDRSKETAFLKAKSAESYRSRVRISKNHLPMLTLSTPIRKLGRITGVLMADVNLRNLWDMMDNIKIGKTGRAYLIDEQGRLLSHPDKKIILQNENPLNPNIIRDVLAGNIGSKEEFDRQGERLLVSYAPVDKMNWGVVMVHPVKEAYTFSKIMALQSWILILCSVLGTIFISLILSFLMSRPINMLIKATQHVTKGDFDHSLPTHHKDDVGRLFNSFNTMTQKLKTAQQLERLSTIGKAATAIAHELKNSLVLINTYICLLPERHNDKKFIEEFSQIVPQELDSWKNMLQTMVDYSKFYQFQTEKVDINSLIKDVVFLAHQRAKQNGIDFVVDTNKDLPNIHGNTDKLKQVFLNLINNALEATPPGGMVSMRTNFIEGKPPGTFSYVEIQVNDTGEGVPINRLEKIFEPFYTTKNAGLGLGLSVSKEIVEHHGGRIEIFCPEKGGTSFSVKIPVAKEKTV